MLKSYQEKYIDFFLPWIFLEKTPRYLGAKWAEISVRRGDGKRKKEIERKRKRKEKKEKRLGLTNEQEK